MKVKKIVSELLTAALVYAALTLVIAGGFALSMGFALAATPNVAIPSDVLNNNPDTLPAAHALATANLKPNKSAAGN
jgi:hypothetical protein